MLTRPTWLVPGSLVLGIVLTFLFSEPRPAGAQNQNFGNAASLQVGLTATVRTIKATRGTLAWMSCLNTNAAPAYVQLFNIPGAVTLGSSTPTIAQPVVSGSATTLYYNATFTAAIKVAATTTPTGSTAPAQALNCNFGFQ